MVLKWLHTANNNLNRGRGFHCEQDQDLALEYLADINGVSPGTSSTVNNVNDTLAIFDFTQIRGQ